MIYTAGLMAEYERFGSATMGYMLLAEMDKQVRKENDAEHYVPSHAMCWQFYCSSGSCNLLLQEIA